MAGQFIFLYFIVIAHKAPLDFFTRCWIYTRIHANPGVPIIVPIEAWLKGPSLDQHQRLSFEDGECTEINNQAHLRASHDVVHLLLTMYID